MKEKHPNIPFLLFAKGVSVSELTTVPASVFGIDETVDPRSADASLVLQGNLDPCVLYGDAAYVRAATLRMKERFRGRAWIANLGHGVPKDADPDMVQVFVDTIRTRRRCVRVGTRGSPLAMMQARTVTRWLHDHYPMHSFEIVVVATKGDQNQEAWLHKLGATDSSFAKELENALHQDRIDIAVHSLKDMESTIPKELRLVAITERCDARDVLVSRKYKSMSAMPRGSVIGTTSLRRKFQIMKEYPQVVIEKCRGTIETRLRKSGEAPYAGVVMAAAGLKRMGKFDRDDVHPINDINEYAVGQGCLGIECREDDAEVMSMCQELNHEPSRARCVAERAMLAAIHGGCGTPVSVRSHYTHEGHVALSGSLFDENGGVRSYTASGPDPLTVGNIVGAELAHRSPL